MRLFRRLLLWSLTILLLYVGGLLLYGTLTDWVPEKEAPALVVPPSSGQAAQAVVDRGVVRLLTWNVGYGGLGDKDFFFYNRGDFFWTEPGTVRPSLERIAANLSGQRLTVANTLSDIFLLQEVDSAARRSHYVNELDTLRTARADYVSAFAPNFKSGRVPLPIFQPWDHYGAVTGGLLSLSRYRPSASTRLQLPGEHPWPTKLFQLDRCALRQEFATRSGRTLVVYNVHLSAYDKDGSVRRQQMDALREWATADYQAGNYVVIGGDWNQLPPGFNWFSLNPTVERVELPVTIGFDYMPAGWKYAYDPGVATVRSSDQPYDAHRTRRSLIDFYLLSPNLRIRQVKGLEQSFQYSDHQPVYLEVEFLD